MFDPNTLTDQQSAILSEGLCPHCLTAVDQVDDSEWHCPGCDRSYELETTWAVSLVQCWQCDHKWVGVHPPGTEQFECPSCGWNMGAIVDGNSQ